MSHRQELQWLVRAHGPVLDRPMPISQPRPLTVLTQDSIIWRDGTRMGSVGCCWQNSRAFEVRCAPDARGHRDSANTGSIAVHRAFGFEPVGTIRSAGWKFDRWLDVVLMQKSLGHGDANPPSDSAG